MKLFFNLWTKTHVTEEIGSVSEDLKGSSENEIQKTSEEKFLNTNSSDEEDEGNRNEMSLVYRDRCLRRSRASLYSSNLVNLE